MVGERRAGGATRGGHMPRAQQWLACATAAHVRGTGRRDSPCKFSWERRGPTGAGRRGSPAAGFAGPCQPPSLQTKLHVELSRLDRRDR